MREAEYSDEVILTVTWYLDREPQLPPSVRANVERINSSPSGATAVSIAAAHVEAPDHEERQLAVHDSLAKLLEQTKAFFESVPDRSNSKLILSIAVVPEAGKAGFVFEPQLLREWALLGAALEIESWPGASWRPVDE